MRGNASDRTVQPGADGDGKGKIELQEDELSKVKNKVQGGKLG